MSALENEICLGYTDKIIAMIAFLETPSTKVVYNCPFEILCWFWFLAYVLNYKSRHNHVAFKNVPYATLCKPLRNNYVRFVEVVENYCDSFFTRQQFLVAYTEIKGFYLVSNTAVWLDLICSVKGQCYSMPDTVVDCLDRMGCHYFHDNGLLVGPIALINHQCDCDISYGFDWQRLKKKKTRSSCYRVTDIVPVYLSWDHARIAGPKRPKKFKIGSEIVVKYFEPNNQFTHSNFKAWFSGNCHCTRCSNNQSLKKSLQAGSTDKEAELLDSEPGIVCNHQINISHSDDVLNAHNVVVLSYNASTSKRFKQRSLNKTKSVLSMCWKKAKNLAKKMTKPKLKSLPTEDPYDVWFGEYLMANKNKKQRMH